MEVPELPGKSHDESLLSARRVLYVDDEEAAREIFLLSFGDDFEVYCAKDAEEALAILAERPMNVVVADLRMPGRSGIDLLEEIAHSYPGVQRILATAYASQQSAIDGINRAGLARYVSKPWHTESLRSILSEAIANAHLDLALGWLREETQAREREAALAVTQGRILHDLANVHFALESLRAKFGKLYEDHRRAFSGEAAAEWESELKEFRAVCSHISNLHSVTRLRARVSKTTASRHRLRDIFDTVLPLVTARKSSHIRFDVLCEETEVIFGSRIDVTRILVNLLTNAVQAIDESNIDDGVVALSAERLGSRVAIRVSDNGPGMPETVRARLFKGEITGREERGGTGLGLLICRDLAASNSGTVELESTGPTGTTFVLSLPAEARIEHSEASKKAFRV